MDIIVNGKNSTGDFGTVEKLLQNEEIDPKLVVVELNGKILPVQDYESTQLKTGDVIEIVQFVAGG